MGAGVLQRTNGPWLMEVDFPGRFSNSIVPEIFEDITDSVHILTPPTPIYGAVCGGNPIGLHIKGAYPFMNIKLPVFEWTGLEQSVRSPFPIRNQHYFALSDKFKGESFSTARVTIGKIALQDDKVACSLPVQESRLSGPIIVEISTPKQPDVRESVAQAIFTILSGESLPEFSYTQSNFDYAMNRAKERRELMQRVKLAREPRTKLQKLLNRN